MVPFKDSDPIQDYAVIVVCGEKSKSNKVSRIWLFQLLYR